MECEQHNTTFLTLYSYNNTSITLNLLVRIKWIKYIINIEMHFVGYLYIMNLSTRCISMEQTHMHVNSTFVNVFLMWLCVCESKWRFNWCQ